MQCNKQEIQKHNFKVGSDSMQDMKKASSKNAEGSLSASRRVYLDLRKKITEMTLLPGTRIVERDIAAEHGTSRTPVHEAVQRLAEEGLIEVTQRVGTFVARIPLDQLEEAMLVRTALEGAIIDRAAARITPEGLDRLRRIIADQHLSVDGLDYQGFHNGDEIFHETLADIAGLRGVWRIIQQAKTQVDRYRRLTLPIPGRMKGVVLEHEIVVDALEKGLKHEAAVAMHEHLDHVLPVVEVAKMLRPDYFTNHLSGGRDPFAGV
jgi:DNA-binding GntR family transcriptional regulator